MLGNTVGVIDGDTIAVRIDGKREKIRIIGLDAIGDEKKEREERKRAADQDAADR